MVEASAVDTAVGAEAFAAVEVEHTAVVEVAEAAEDIEDIAVAEAGAEVEADVSAQTLAYHTELASVEAVAA